jgi:hypothetical protein
LTAGSFASSFSAADSGAEVDDSLLAEVVVVVSVVVVVAVPEPTGVSAMSLASAGALRVAITAQIRIATDNTAADAAMVTPA